MSRLDNLGEILDGYEGRKHKPDYMPSEEDIKKIHELLVEDHSFVKLAYIACKRDEFKEIFVPRALYMHGPKLPIISDNKMMACVDMITEYNNFDFAGVVYYTADMHPAEFLQKEHLSLKKSVPDGVKMPDLVLVIDHDENYIMFKGKEMYDNIDVTGS